MSRKPERTAWLKTIEEIDVGGKKVLVRLDLDIPLKKSETRNPKYEIGDGTRLLNSLPTIKYLVDRKAKITIIGHLGRPGGKRVEELSLKPVDDWFQSKFPGAGIRVEENLRFDPGEEANSPTFAQNIVRRLSPDVYIFEAFGSYRPHASVVLVPKLVPRLAIGFRFAAEISHLSKVLENPKKPLIFILGGAKADTKITLIPKLAEVADEILIGGLLPARIQNSEFRIQNLRAKLKIAELRSDGLDITAESANMFAGKIMRAGTVVWNGPVGAFEKSAKSQISNLKSQKVDYQKTSVWGTYLVAKAINETQAYTVVGGGDTEAALTALRLESGIDWISSGGGAMLYYLAHQTLPFLEAVK